jgi:hypothetical protein
MSNSRARYGIMASSPSFLISPETLSGPTDLFLPIAANLLLIILLLMTKSPDELARYIYEILRSELNTKNNRNLEN